MSEAKIEGDQIIIRLDISALPVIVSGGWACNALPPLKVTDSGGFAKDLCRALNDENEEGTTPLHRVIDKAVLTAVEQGAFGIDEISEEEAEKLAASLQKQPKSI
jgi:hypothetical protein